MSIYNINAIEAPAKKAGAIIRREIDRCKKYRYTFARRYNRLSEKQLPEKLKYTVKRGEKYYTGVWSENGQKKTTYLGKDENETVKLVQQKRFYELALKDLNVHVGLLNNRCLSPDIR